MSDTCEQISSSARFAISTPQPRSVTILLAIAQKSSLYYIRTYFDRRRRTMCWKSPLWAHKECRSALSAQHISASARSTCQTANRYQNIYIILHTVTHRVFHTYSTGARLQIAFIFLAKRLHFALKSIQNRISIIGYHSLLWNRYHPVVFALDGNRQRAKQTDLLL